jgi:CRISPR-associated protein Cas2
MRIILIYDVGIERVSKIMRICREYLEHIQNSVFEGDITEANLKELKMRLKEKIEPTYDSVIIFNLWAPTYQKEIIGLNKNDEDNII